MNRRTDWAIVACLALLVGSFATMLFGAISGDRVWVGVSLIPTATSLWLAFRSA